MNSRTYLEFDMSNVAIHRLGGTYYGFAQINTYLRGPLIRVAYLTVALAVLLLISDLAVSVFSHTTLTSLLHHQHLSVQHALRRAEMHVSLPLLLAWTYAGYWSAQVLHLIADQVPLRFSTL